MIQYMFVVICQCRWIQVQKTKILISAYVTRIKNKDARILILDRESQRECKSRQIDEHTDHSPLSPLNSAQRKISHTRLQVITDEISLTNQIRSTARCSQFSSPIDTRRDSYILIIRYSYTSISDTIHYFVIVILILLND